MTRTLIAIIASLLLAACASEKARASYETQVLTPRAGALAPGKPVLIRRPANGVFEQVIYSHSGDQTVEAFRAEFAKHSDRVSVLTDCPEGDCGASIPTDFDGYFIDLDIVHWEERQTAWSLRNDRVIIKVAVIEHPGQRKLGEVFLQGVSTLNTLGGDHVEDMLPALVPDYVTRLYQP